MSRRTLHTLIPLLAVLAGPGCDVPEEPEDTGPIDLTVSLPPPTFGYQVSTEPTLVPPGSEAMVCSVVRVEPLGDELSVWVNRLESLSSDNSHHMNVLLGQFSFLDAFLGDGAFEAQLGVGLGTHDCGELNDLMSTSFPVFPSQRTSQQITMPEGVGIPMVAPLVLVLHHHYVNTQPRPVLINTALNVERMDPADVEQAASLIFDDIGSLDVPPGGQRVVHRTCGVDRDVELALVSTHTHEQTECTTLNRFSGETGDVEPDPFFVNKSWETPPILHFEEDTFALSAGDGVHWACHITDSDGDGVVNDGTAAGEMCVFAAVAYPASIGKDEIIATMESQDLLAVYALLGEVMAPCATHPEAESPWPMTDEPNLGPPVDTCQSWDQTESNTLD
ncbi:MAG: hypothetical protein KDA24_28730 [Deltaproteobacteria bacterium]|nr:hypothetical protein [Deltaproteobacteria bacterium]